MKLIITIVKISFLYITILLIGVNSKAQTIDFTNNQLKKQESILECFEFKKYFSPYLQKSNTESIRWEFDTLCYIYTSKTLPDLRDIFKYNQQGFLEEKIYQIKVNNEWENNMKTLLLRDNNNNFLSKIDYSWQNNSWERIFNRDTYFYSYDSNNNLLSELNEFDGTNKSQILYIYDSNNNLLISEGQMWINDSWLTVTRQTNTYDSNNNKLTHLFEMLNNITDKRWENLYLYTYTYDLSNNQLSFLEQKWGNDSWMNISLETNTYDSIKNLLIESQYYKWDWENNSWGIYSVETFLYDSKNNLINKLIKKRENNSLLITYTYDENNNLLNELQQNWQNNSWVNSYQCILEYDENSNGISAETWEWNGESWQPTNNAISSTNTIFLYYNNMQSLYTTTSKDKLTASYVKVSDTNTNILPVDAIESNDILVYPNPTTGELRIRKQRSALANYETTFGVSQLGIEGIEIYDIMGKKLSTVNYQLSTVNSIDISQLPAGIYFVRITTEKCVITKKVVKK